MEHCDRIKRLLRLSAMLPIDQRPVFYEGIVPANRLPAGFGVDIPVLRVVFPDRTFFDTNRSDLRPEAAEIAAVVADDLRREPPDVALFVAGHADARGSRPFNEKLSIDRANALAEQLVDSANFSASIWRIGFGEDMPLVAGDDDRAYDRNRRIEFLFAARWEAVAVWLADQQLGELCQGRTIVEIERCRHRIVPRKYIGYEVKRARVSVGTAGRPFRQVVPPGPGVRPADVGKSAPSRTILDRPVGSRVVIDLRSPRAPPVRIDL